MATTSHLLAALTVDDFPTGLPQQHKHSKIRRMQELVRMYADEYGKADEVNETREYDGRRMLPKGQILTLVVDKIKPTIGKGFYKKKHNHGMMWIIDENYNHRKLRKRVCNLFGKVLDQRKYSTVRDLLLEVTTKHISHRHSSDDSILAFCREERLAGASFAPDVADFANCPTSFAAIVEGGTGVSSNDAESNTSSAWIGALEEGWLPFHPVLSSQDSSNSSSELSISLKDTQL